MFYFVFESPPHLPIKMLVTIPLDTLDFAPGLFYYYFSYYNVFFWYWYLSFQIAFAIVKTQYLNNKAAILSSIYLR